MGRTVILHQHNGSGIRIILLKIHNIADICTTPAINGLIRIANYAEIAIATGQKGSKLILCSIGILILIHQHIPEPSLIPLPNFLIFLQKGNSHQQQIIKVQGIIFSQHCLVFLIYLSYLFLVKIMGLGFKGCWTQHLVLGIGNGIADAAGSILLFI